MYGKSGSEVLQSGLAINLPRSKAICSLPKPAKAPPYLKSPSPSSDGFNAKRRR